MRSFRGWKFVFAFSSLWLVRAYQSKREQDEKSLHNFLTKHQYDHHKDLSNANIRHQFSIGPTLPVDLSIAPASNATMDDAKLFLTLLEKNTAFSFSHYNDGEIEAITECGINSTIDFGRQKCSPALSKAMYESMLKRSSNFYFGIPCLCEFHGKFFFSALKLLNISHNLLNDPPLVPGVCPDSPPKLQFPSIELKRRLSVATALINGNYMRVKSEFIRILSKAVVEQHRGVHVVIGEGANFGSLPFPLTSVAHNALRQSFDLSYQNMRTEHFLHR